MKGILLLSGGFDSVVAGWIMKKRGVDLIAVHCSLEPVVNDTSTKKVETLAHHLAIPYHIVKIGNQLSEIVQKADNRYYFVLQKRFMLRIAEHFAQLTGAKCIVTGENLGQVSSQTLDNLTVITKGAKIPLFRPLLSYDKQDIITLAKDIGTYKTSVGPEMCDAFGPKNPVTKARFDRILKEEAQFDSLKLISEAINAPIDRITILP